MSDKLFLVTAATGNTGEPTVRLLLERGHRVRAFVHHDDARSHALAATGAEVVVGDLLDFHSVTAALEQVTAAYFCYPIEPGLLQATATFAEAASEAGVSSVVNMSQICARPEAGSDSAREHWLAERLLNRTPMWTAHLRPTLFAEWLRWTWSRRDEEGVVSLPFGDGRHAPIASEDQAYVIAAILEDPARYDRQVYPLHGPIEMSHEEIADAMSRALGLPVRYELVDLDDFADAMMAFGYSSYRVQHLRNIVVDYRNGIFAGTNNLVEVIAGKTPMTVEDYVIAHKDFFSSR